MNTQLKKQVAKLLAASLMVGMAVPAGAVSSKAAVGDTGADDTYKSYSSYNVYNSTLTFKSTTATLASATASSVTFEITSALTNGYSLVVTDSNKKAVTSSVSGQTLTLSNVTAGTYTATYDADGDGKAYGSVDVTLTVKAFENTDTPSTSAKKTALSIGETTVAKDTVDATSVVFGNVAVDADTGLWTVYDVYNTAVVSNVAAKFGDSSSELVLSSTDGALEAGSYYVFYDQDGAKEAYTPSDRIKLTVEEAAPILKVEPTVKGTTATATVSAADITGAINDDDNKLTIDATGDADNIKTDEITLPALNGFDLDVVTIKVAIPDVVLTLNTATLDKMTDELTLKVDASESNDSASTVTTNNSRLRTKLVKNAPIYEISLGNVKTKLSIGLSFPVVGSANAIICSSETPAEVLTSMVKAGQVYATTEHLSTFTLATTEKVSSGSGSGGASGSGSTVGNNTSSGANSSNNNSSNTTTTPSTSVVNGFNDVPTTAWFAEYVKYITDKNIMNGVGTNSFAPNATATRGMMATIVYRMAGEPETTTAAGFTDVDASQWYAKGIAWCKANGHVNGMTATTFVPNGNITREQFATMLYRYAKGTAPAESKIASFADAASVSAYAKDAMNWAVDQGIVNGSNNQLKPTASATRAELATMIARYMQK